MTIFFAILYTIRFFYVLLHFILLIMQTDIISCIKASIAAKEQILLDKTLMQNIEIAAAAIINACRNEQKVLFCGNGGSAADAQHLAAELSGRFYLNRRPLYAEALHVNTSYITAAANDYGYNAVYARMIEACGKKNDILVAISTSGNSENIIAAIQKARQTGLYVIGLTGRDGGKMKSMCHCLLNVPSQDTPRIQEMHITIGHILCYLTEKNLFA